MTSNNIEQDLTVYCVLVTTIVNFFNVIMYLFRVYYNLYVVISNIFKFSVSYEIIFLI